MRNIFLVVLLIALVCAFTFSVTGQEEALPPVQPRLAASAGMDAEASLPGEPFLDLAAEPIAAFHEPTLAEAAEQNDFVTFDALYRAARTRGESVAAFQTLHEVWTFALTDPIGAFYGPDLHDRLARAYPGFAAFIEPYEIVDDNGEVFYPTSETRAFLLEQARLGSAARIQVAERRQASRPAAPDAGRPVPAPAVVTPPPVSVASATPATIQTEAAGLPVTAEVSAAAPQPIPAPIPVIAPAAPQGVPVTVPTRDSRRGLLMLITGLATLALIAVIMRLQRPTTRVAQ